MINEEIIKFLENAGPIFFVTPSPVRAIGLEKFLPNFHIICSEPCDWLNQIIEAGAKVFCLQDSSLKSAGRILRNSSVIEYIKNNSATKTANILTFKPSPMIAKVCADNGFRYLGNDWKLNRDFEDKISFAEMTEISGVPNANSKVLLLDDNFVIEALDFFDNKKYVAQFSRGYSGNSSFLISSQEEFNHIVKTHFGRKMKIADYIRGESYTLNVCLGKFGLLSSYPIFQITGFSEFNKNILGTCGNDYSFATRNLSQKILERIMNSVEKVSYKMREAGYLGIAGFDFVVNDNEAHLIEVNPRFIGSVPVFTKLQLAVSDLPFLMVHILSFLDFDFKDTKINDDRRKFDFSQIILRNNSSDDRKISKTLESGIYEIADGALSFFQKAYFADSNLSPNQFFLQTAIRDAAIAPDMEYANIQFSCGIMKDKGVFTEEFEQIKDLVFKKIILT
jgi:predicted ATP-grasp superfamily ATP-dependent carboligase